MSHIYRIDKMNFKIPQNINFYDWWKKNDSEYKLSNLTEHQLLDIANEINDIFSDTDIDNRLTLPKLVVVGTQSSGKSSVLNSIMAMDILPTGKNMVTRTPLNIQLNQINDQRGWIEISDKVIDITVPTPTKDEVDRVVSYIKQKTVEIAGPDMNISHTPINMRIYSPYVPNLSLTDLPGLTMVACVDKGQPEDIKDKIEELVSDYIKQERTIIMAVMQARCDLETDLGLALIKKYDNLGKRTIGILTKPDLMNDNTHIGGYLLNDISKNLMLSHGYYVIRNRGSHNINIYEGFEQEKEYFKNHPEYSKDLYRDRIGMNNLTKDLNKLLISSITELLPSVMTEIMALDNEVKQKLDGLGEGVPTTKEGKMTVLNKYSLDFYHSVVDSLESNGAEFNTGKKIKDIFTEYKSSLMKINPFDDTDIYNDKYFEDIISSFEGNHMSFYIPPVQILEACMTDKRLRPISKLSETSLRCVDDIIDLLIDAIRDILKLDRFSKYSLLAVYITTVVTDNIISNLKINAKNMIKDYINTEECYIWTDDPAFEKVLEKVCNDSSHKSINILLNSYYDSIKSIICHTIPKIIMKTVIRDLENSLLSFLFQNVVVEDRIDTLREDESIEQRRRCNIKLLDRISKIKKMTSDMSKN